MTSAAMNTQTDTPNDDGPVSSDYPTSGGRLVATNGHALPLRHTSLEVEAAGGIARVILRQRFVNDQDVPLNVHYSLPLPHEAAISGFSFQVGEKNVVGEVDSKKKARERFETAIAHGQTAAIVEQERSTMFTEEVGNIPAGETIITEVVVDQRLIFASSTNGDGQWEWRFPTVIGPRYLGAAGRVADAERVAIDVADGPVKAAVTFELCIADELSGTVSSTSHALDVSGPASKDADDETIVRFRSDSPQRMDRDIVVRWPVARDEATTSITLARPSDPKHSGDTYGLMTVVPPKAAASKKSVARDLTLLIDTSGSMSGRPLQQAKRIMTALLDSLGKRDRVELMEFSSQVTRFRPEPMVATRDTKKAAAKWIKGLRAGGCTEMKTAIVESLKALRDDAQRQVVVLTDGYIGFEREIVETILNANKDGVRVHWVGVGSAVNRSLSAAGARAGRGIEVIAELDTDVEPIIDRLLARTVNPLVTNLKIEGALKDTVPAELPDLYAGSPAMIALKVAGGTEGNRITVTGDTAEGPWSAEVEVKPIALGGGHQGVATLYGRERVEDLEMRVTATGDATVDNLIEATGIRFQIATRLTSWVAIHEEVLVDDPSKSKDVRQPQELPYGMSVEMLGLRGAAAPSAAMAPAPQMMSFGSADSSVMASGGAPPGFGPPAQAAFDGSASPPPPPAMRQARARMAAPPSMAAPAAPPAAPASPPTLGRAQIGSTETAKEELASFDEGALGWSDDDEPTEATEVSADSPAAASVPVPQLRPAAPSELREPYLLTNQTPEVIASEKRTNRFLWFVLLIVVALLAVAYYLVTSANQGSPETSAPSDSPATQPKQGPDAPN